MVHYLLYISLSGETAPWYWDVDLTSRGIVLLHTRNVEEAIHYVQSSPLIMILVDLPRMNLSAVESIEKLSGAMPDHRPPLIAVQHGQWSDDDRLRCASAGVNDLIHTDDPAHFMAWRLDLLARLEELHRYEQTRLDVVKLATQTRDRLHELSQPLSAVQGRLQLLAAKCPSDDPNAPLYQELVRLIFQVSRQVMEIQQLHRSAG